MTQTPNTPAAPAAAPLAEAPAIKIPKVIAVASGKGGVGKTWFSITLAHALSISRKKVLLFDADLGLANADIQLGLMPEKDISHVVSGEATLDKVITRYAQGNFDVIAGRSGSGQLASLPASRLAQLRADITDLANKNYDHVIIDLGAGIERSVRAISMDCDCYLIVCTDEPTSLTDAYTFIKVTLAEKPDTDFRIVCNQAHTRQDGEKTFNTLVKACKGFLKYTPQLAGIIRRDRRVSESIRHQTPILIRYPNAEAAVDAMTIARHIMGEK